MAKIIQFQAHSAPEKFGPQRAQRRKSRRTEKEGQLDLFTGARLVKLNRLSPFEEALLRDEQGDKEGAREYYQKAIEKGDSTADAYCNLGILEFQAGNFPQAINCFAMSLKHNPRHYEAHYNLANLYAEAGNYQLARLHYETAIEIEPSFSNCYYNLGLTLALSNQYKDAVQVLTRYRQLTPGEEHQLTDDLIAKLKLGLLDR